MSGMSVGMERDAEGVVGVRRGGSTGEGGNDIERLDASAVAGGIDNIRSWHRKGSRVSARSEVKTVGNGSGPHQFGVLARVVALVLVV